MLGRFPGIKGRLHVAGVLVIDQRYNDIFKSETAVLAEGRQIVPNDFVGGVELWGLV